MGRFKRVNGVISVSRNEMLLEQAVREKEPSITEAGQEEVKAMAGEKLVEKNLAGEWQARARPIFCGLAVLLCARATAAEPPQVPKSSALTIVDAVRFFPAPKREKMMVGGKFAGSNVSPAEGFHVMAEITAEPKSGEWTELHFENRSAYRWVRYEAPPGSRGNIAELEFDSGSRKLNGSGFGSPGVLPPGGHWKAAFDGKTESFFNSEIADGQFVGLDLGEQASTKRVAFSPAPRDYEASQDVVLRSPTPGTTIRYTLDGTTPGPAQGLLYTAPIKVAGTTTLSAVAFKEGLAPSPVASGTYLVGKPTVRINSFHVGNSLTGNAARFPMFARTAGVESRFESFLIGGAFTVKLWKAKEEADKERFATAYGKAALPLDHFTVQPRDFDIDEEVEHELKFFRFVREKSPQVQPWLYAEWVEMNRQRPSDKGLVPSYQMSKVFPASTWEESMSAMLLYVEEVQHRVNQLDGGGKRARILPCSLALGWARNLVDNNQLPGVPAGQASFYQTFFEDMVHVNPNGCYLVDLIWYAAFTGRSPEGKLLPVGTTLTPPQAKVLQQLAWEIVKNYPDCGLYEEGTTPVAAPRFSLPSGPISEPTPIHLASATPGVFYRYTLDGTIPTRSRGYVYCGVITARPGMTVKAVAYQSGMRDSGVSESSYSEGKPGPINPE
jgi:Chitobiase/beta-hexosaminidase C-terminal domain